jgi:hypothetical protein
MYRFGWNEKRLGYLESAQSNFSYRWTVASTGAAGNSSGIWMSASNRTAGTIDSIYWNNYELVNSWDHGRQLQVAIANMSGEAYNPSILKFVIHDEKLKLGLLQMDKEFHQVQSW